MGSLACVAESEVTAPTPANDVDAVDITRRDLPPGHGLPSIAKTNAIHAEHRKPRTWGECQSQELGAAIPCPWYSCRHHLGLDGVLQDGQRSTMRAEAILFDLKIHPDDIENHETCALAVANRREESGLPVAETAEAMRTSPGTVEAAERIGKWKISVHLGGTFRDWDNGKRE